MSIGLGPLELVLLPILGVGFLIWLGIPATLVYAGIAKSQGALRYVLLSAAGLYVLLFVIGPLLSFVAIAAGTETKSSGWSRVHHADGSCTERTSKDGETSSLFHPQCPVPGPIR
jgi:hypothetical protein